MATNNTLSLSGIKLLTVTEASFLIGIDKKKIYKDIKLEKIPVTIKNNKYYIKPEDLNLYHELVKKRRKTKRGILYFVAFWSISLVLALIIVFIFKFAFKFI